MKVPKYFSPYFVQFNSSLHSLEDMKGHRMRREVHEYCHFICTLSICIDLARAPKHILGCKAVRNYCKNFPINFHDTLGEGMNLNKD